MNGRIFAEALFFFTSFVSFGYTSVLRLATRALAVLSISILASTIPRAQDSTPTPYIQLRQHAGTRASQPQTPLPFPPRPLRIGWFGPTYTSGGRTNESWWTAQFLVNRFRQPEEPNQPPVQLLTRWSDKPWKNGASEAARLVFQDQVCAIVGSMDGPSTHIAEQIVAKACLPLISPFTTDKTLTLAGVPWMFALAPTDQTIADFLIAHLVATVPATPHPILIAATDHDSRSLTKEIERALSAHRLAPAFVWQFPPGSTDFSHLLRRLPSDNPPPVLILANSLDSAHCIAAIRQAHAAATIIGSHHCATTDFLDAAPACERIQFPIPQPWQPDSLDAAQREFIEAFRATFGRAPDYRAAFTHDALSILLQAIAKGGTQPDQLRDAIINRTSRPEPARLVNWDATGQNKIQNLIMATTEGGRVVPYSRKRVW